jgi:hypothetical protein
MIAEASSIRKAEAQFQQALALVRQATTQGQRIDLVERALFDQLLQMGFHLLSAFAEAAGDGDHGPQVERQGRTLRRSETKVPKPYRSIFGVLSIARFVYAPGVHKAVAWAPVDAQLGLPAGEQSYVLEDWLQRVCLKESFAEGVQSLRDLLGVTPSVRGAETMNRNLAGYVEGFLDAQPPPDGTSEAEILVLTADAKGVPMRRPLEERLQEHAAAAKEAAAPEPEKPPPAAEAPASPSGGPPAPAAPSQPKRSPRQRLKRGEKRTRKQMAYVGAVYTIAPFVRTADEVLDELRRQERQAERPRPQNKQVFAEMTRFREEEVLDGQACCFARLAWMALARHGEGKTLVCLLDGQRSLWDLKESWFGRAVGILDLLHVTERLWKTAHCLHAEGSRGAEDFVDHHLRMLLEGQVGCVIGLFRRMLTQGAVKGKKAETLRETIGYFANNRQYMRYDEYLAAGYPIGTGVIEGACRHFVKDRMELAGMRWEIEGAQAMLSLRAVYLNGQWDTFIEHRIQCEQETLYAQAA